MCIPSRTGLMQIFAKRSDIGAQLLSQETQRATEWPNMSANILLRLQREPTLSDSRAATGRTRIMWQEMKGITSYRKDEDRTITRISPIQTTLTGFMPDTEGIHRYFNTSLSQKTVPHIFKSSIILLVPKKAHTTTMNDFRPVAFTCRHEVPREAVPEAHQLCGKAVIATSSSTCRSQGILAYPRTLQ